MFEIIKAGVSTSIQNLGRFGEAHLGVKQGGVMDEYAYRWGEKLLGNSDANAFEILLGGVKLKVLSDSSISVCGGDLDFRINGVKKDIWQTHNVKKDDIITFEKRQSGMRAYLSFKSDFTTVRRVPKRFIPNYEKNLTLNIFLTYQEKYFDKESFFNTEYELTPSINRMGYKLKGEPLIPKNNGIISEGIAFGSVQIPKDGQPIILLKDRQTIGGYPKIGVVLAKDCFRLSQMPIGSTIKFKEISIEKAENKMREFYDFFK